MKRTQCEIKFDLARPAIEKMVVKGLKPEDAEIQKWGWVDCHILALHIRILLRNQGIKWPLKEGDGKPKPEPSWLFEYYGHLKVDCDGNPASTWCDTGGYTIEGTPPSDPQLLFTVWIPAGVSMGIQSLAEQGIVRVSVEKQPFMTAGQVYIQIGHTVDGKKFMILNGGKGDGSYRLAPYQQ